MKGTKVERRKIEEKNQFRLIYIYIYIYGNVTRKLPVYIYWGQELVPVEEIGRGCGRVNMVQILCTHVCKWKNDTC
jgi:hypothetical protein